MILWSIYCRKNSEFWKKIKNVQIDRNLDDFNRVLFNENQNVKFWVFQILRIFVKKIAKIIDSKNALFLSRIPISVCHFGVHIAWSAGWLDRSAKWNHKLADTNGVSVWKRAQNEAAEIWKKNKGYPFKFFQILSFSNFENFRQKNR